MNSDQEICLFFIVLGVIGFISTFILIFKSATPDPDKKSECLALMCVSLIVGSYFFTNGFHKISYSEKITYTEAITVAKSNDDYFVTKDDVNINIDGIEEIPNAGKENYQLKTITGYSLSGKEVKQKNILIVPVDTEIVQEN